LLIAQQALHQFPPASGQNSWTIQSCWRPKTSRLKTCKEADKGKSPQFWFSQLIHTEIF